MNIAEFLTIAYSTVPDRTALVFEDVRLTYGELYNRVNRLANALSDLGVGKGDRVAVMQVNCNQAVETCFAATRLDAIFVPVNFRARGNELADILSSAEPTVLFVGGDYVDLVKSETNRIIPPNYIASIEKRVGGEWLFYEDLIESSSPQQIHFPDGDDEENAILMFTASADCEPEAWMHTHQSFTSYVLANACSPDPDLDQRNFLSVPLCRSAGVRFLLASVYGGGSTVVARQFEPREWLEMVQRERVNRTIVASAMLKQLVEHPELGRYDLSSLQVINYEADSITPEMIGQAINELPGVSFVNASC